MWIVRSEIVQRRRSRGEVRNVVVKVVVVNVLSPVFQ